MNSQDGQEPPERERSVSYSAIVLAMLTEGLQSVRAMEPPPSRHSLVRARKELEAKGATKEAAKLTTFITQAYPVSSPTGGIGKLTRGSKRPYSIMERRGELVVRVPVGVLQGAAKGGAVWAEAAQDGSGITLQIDEA